MSNDRNVVDEIDRLVDEQLANYENRTGYDHNPHTPRCPHCPEEWHGLPVTTELRRRRNVYECTGDLGTTLAGYRYDTDTSALVCPGSAFIGPVATPGQLDRIRNGTAYNPTSPLRAALWRNLLQQQEPLWETPADPFPDSPPEYTEPTATRPEAPWAVQAPGIREGDPIAWQHTDGTLTEGYAHHEPDGTLTIRTSAEQLAADREHARRQGNTILQRINEVRDTLTGAGLLDPEPQPRTDRRPPVPRPSTTPPMWANNPARTRRNRNRAADIRTPRA